MLNCTVTDLTPRRLYHHTYLEYGNLAFFLAFCLLSMRVAGARVRTCVRAVKKHLPQNESQFFKYTIALLQKLFIIRTELKINELKILSPLKQTIFLLFYH